VRPADGEQHAAPVAVERDQAADETAKLPQARRRRDQVEGRRVAEERVQGGDRPQCGARGETRVLGAHVVAGELPARVAEKWDGAAEVEGEAGLEGFEGDDARRRVDVAGERARGAGLRVGRERPEERQAEPGCEAGGACDTTAGSTYCARLEAEMLKRSTMTAAARAAKPMAGASGPPCRQRRTSGPAEAASTTVHAPSAQGRTVA